WHVYETPGHCPSHVCLFQPEHRILITGDHVLGRISLFLEYGWSPDPAGEFLSSLDSVDALDARLALSGHGPPFTDVHAHVDADIAAYRKLVAEHLAAIGAGIDGGPQTGPSLARAVYESPRVAGNASWMRAQTLCCLTHLQSMGAVVRNSHADTEIWRKE